MAKLDWSRINVRKADPAQFRRSDAAREFAERAKATPPKRKVGRKPDSSEQARSANDRKRRAPTMSPARRDEVRALEKAAKRNKLLAKAEKEVRRSDAKRLRRAREESERHRAAFAARQGSHRDQQMLAPEKPASIGRLTPDHLVWAAEQAGLTTDRAELRAEWRRKLLANPTILKLLGGEKS